MATDTTRGRQADEPAIPGSARERGEAGGIQPTGHEAGEGAPPGSVAARVGTERIARLLRRVRATSGETFPMYAPVTGELLAEVPTSGTDDVAEAFARAREAQRSWERVPVAERARLLLRLHDLVFARQAEILDVIQAESGKARKHAFEELCDVLLNARYYARTAPRLLRPRRRAGLVPVLSQVQERRHPKGVVGVIAPWNYPFTLAISDALPALVAGNAVVTKPASQTVLSALVGAELLAQAGLPDGLWQIVAGPGATIGGAIADHADYVCFTGSTRTGRAIAQRCGERLIGCTLELGGKNPLLVLDDADVDRAAEGAVRACFSNAGQLCISVERVYVADRVYDAFVERFLERVEAMRVEPTFDFGPDMGSLISGDQVRRVEEHLDDATSGGATVLTGGEHRPDLGPYFFEPTVLADVRPTMRCHSEETFGPLVSVHRCADDDEAVARANDSVYGLNASVFGRDLPRARSVAGRLRAGTVNVNEAYTVAWGSIDAPMGGVGDSGLGRRHGVEGLLKYTEAQTIAVQRLHPVQPVSGRMSYDTFASGLTAALRLLRRIGRR